MMTDDEIAFRAAMNVLRDTIKSGRMPSGLAAQTRRCRAARKGGAAPRRPGAEDRAARRLRPRLVPKASRASAVGRCG